MNKVILSCFLLFHFSLAQSQNIFRAYIKNSSNREPLSQSSVSLKGTTNFAIADSNGFVTLYNIPAGKQTLIFSHVGQNTKEESFNFPLQPVEPAEILMEDEVEQLDEVIVRSTRSNRTIENIPTRIEIISTEELDEKGNMRPGDIRMLLNETTGIQTQQVSATSASSGIRIQGLDGRYTQILKDGFPLFGGFSGGLGLLQTPPLDLKQVEIIKGSSSTLYGGGAIAGMVNLISKIPSRERELNVLLNLSSAGGLDVSSFYSQQKGKIGLTIYAGYSGNKAYDPSGVGFSAIPKFDRFVFNPKVFVNAGRSTTFSVGLSMNLETRIGGDMQYLHGHGDSVHQYFENNQTQRLSTQFTLYHKLSEISGLAFKNSISHFSRNISIPDYHFEGSQWSSYSELDYNYKKKNADWVFGLNVYTDDFKEHSSDTFPSRNYNQITLGLFVQNTWTINHWLQIEAGLREDYVFEYGFAFLPRVSALFKLSPKFNSRLGAGFGYKTPTIFTEETERIQYRHVLPVSPDSNQLEKSYGINWDFNFVTRISESINFSFNQLFFFTRIINPLIVDTLPGPVYKLSNKQGYMDSKGFETNIKFLFSHFQYYIGYTFVDAHLVENQQARENPLTIRHRLNNVLIYELESNLKLGLEAYYYGTQPLNDGQTGKAFWTFGFMAEKTWKRFSIFVNFENFTDTRQTRFDTIYTGTITNPVFRDIYAPLDGFVFNGGVKLKL